MWFINKGITKMKRLVIVVVGLLCCFMAWCKDNKPWQNGNLTVSENNRYLMHENGTPFFWLGDTGWLMPERLNRDEVEFYLSKCKDAGYNVVQVQTINAVPAINAYGQYSMIDGFNFDNIDSPNVYGYWDHMDHIIKTAENNGIYIGMVCIWVAW